MRAPEYSLLVVKPELMATQGAVCESLHRRGFRILWSAQFEDWRAFIRRFYNDMTPPEYAAYCNAYKVRGWGFVYQAIALTLNLADPIAALKREQGEYARYQETSETTLRGEFGLSSEYNIVIGTRMLAFNGIHAVRDKRERRRTVCFLAAAGRAVGILPSSMSAVEWEGKCSMRS